MITLSSLWQVTMQSSVVPRGTRAYVFQEIYTVFLALGTIVGVVVVGYMLHKAYRYRAAAREGDEDADRPTVGEIPTGGGGGRKLFVSFALSAVIVVSLISWTYFTLLYVERPDPVAGEDPVEIRVVGHQFYWEFVYANGHSTTETMRIPADRRVRLTVTSGDVFHNFGAPDLRVKADAIPGQETETWVEASETGTYPIHCYELCGAGHSYMDGTVRVMAPADYREWYGSTSNESASNASALSPTAVATAGVTDVA
jgi:cytochrome c oxidase subunit 2